MTVSTSMQNAFCRPAMIWSLVTAMNSPTSD
jgi:hypothetical protein